MIFTSLLQAVNQTNLALARRRIEVRRQIEEEEYMLRMLVEEEEMRPPVVLSTEIENMDINVFLKIIFLKHTSSMTQYFVDVLECATFFLRLWKM
ncbi:hypothetical protein G6F56_011726 [Rhizopus delemar]|nr:hypothetical protein G6F56_011726 [Rhizopus delemar]